MDVAGSVYFPQDCHLDPARFMAAMRGKIIQLGGKFENNIDIQTIETRKQQVTAVVGSGRRFVGDQFVIACGSWSTKLLRQVGMKLPLQAGKGYSLSLPNPPEMPQLRSIFAEAKVAITPMGPMGNHLRFGGTMEVGGLDLSINRARVNGIVKSINTYFPKFSGEPFSKVQPWVGLRPVSPDGIPYLGKVAKLPNLTVATGNAMMGLSLAPVSGRLVADLLAGDQPFRPLDALAPGRF
jgi:D-amino-acid dehydrogenase